MAEILFVVRVLESETCECIRLINYATITSISKCNLNGAVDTNSEMVQYNSSSSLCLSYGDSHLNELCIENQTAVVPTELVSDLDMVLHESGSPLTSLQSFVPWGMRFLVWNREHGRDGGNVVRLDMDTISLSIIPFDAGSETGTPEVDMRLSSDAFARSSTSRLEATANSDDQRAQNRWLLGRIHRMAEPRRHSRFELWEILRGVLDDDLRRSSLCPSGLHPDGSCSCESLSMTAESSAHESISRIIILAEALFEVLDEINHHLPTSLSFSAVCLTAPESVVDSFPVKNHAKVDKLDGGDEAEQCYICLSEYEEGEKIRILPCHHEYHMSCVDKWLKEIHGVCPLCRGDVCDGFNESSPIILA